MNKEHTPRLVDLKCVEKCPIHPQNIIIYFCKGHEDIGCYQCMSTSHSKCTTTNIDDIAEGIKESLEYKALLEELTEVKLKAEQSEVKAGENILNSDICLSTVLQDIRNFRQDIDAHLDQMERMVSEEGKQVNQDNRLLMKELGSESKAIRDNVEHILKELRESETAETKLFIKMKQGKSNVLRFKHETDHCHTRIKRKTQSFVFKPNIKLADIFRTNNSFGTICIENSNDVETAGERSMSEKVEKDTQSYSTEGDFPPDKQKELASVTTNSNDVSSNQESVEISFGNENSHEDERAVSGEFENGDKVRSDLVEIKPYIGDKINAKLLSDKEDCDISGIDILSDNEIVLADYNNRSVKVIDLCENKIRDELKLTYHPYDLAVPAENMIAVTLTNTIQIVRRSHLLRQAESISVDGECYGIAGNKNKLFVSFIKPSPKVEILNHQGDVLQKIELGTTRRVLKRPRYIAVCPHERFIYVTDFDTESIVQLNLKGEYVKVFRDTAILNGPYGIHVDLKGHVFVCNYGNDNIYEFSADLSNYKIVLSKTEGIESPQSIYMDSKANRLFVACTDSSDCNEVRTYSHCAEKVKE